jgi:hypothetical protein
MAFSNCVTQAKNLIAYPGAQIYGVSSLHNTDHIESDVAQYLAIFF